MQPSIAPPIATVIPHEIESHGHVRVDDYFWLRQRDDPRVIEYLKAENHYTEAVTASTRELRETLFEEIKARIRQADQSVPYKLGDYLYFHRYEEEKQYAVYCRKKVETSAEEIMIDANVLAEGHEYFSLGELEVSSEQDLLAYSVDTVSRRIYTIYFKNLETGENLPDTIPEVTGNLAWANDNRTLFYSKQDPKTLRSYRIYRHVLGTDPSEDVLVYEESDEAFRTYAYKTKSKKYLIIGSSQTLTSEYRFLEASNPEGAFTVLEPRRRGHKHSVEHFGDCFYFRTNLGGAKNHHLMKAPVDRPGRENWEEVLPHRDDVFFEDFEIFDDYLVISERRGGLDRLRVRPWSGGEEHEIDFDEPAYHAYLSSNYEFGTELLRFKYTSLTTPSSTYDYNLRTREKTLLKRDEVVGDFDRRNYRTERLHATADDGERVPISLVYREGKVSRDGRSPLLLTAYGSYGISRDPTFVPSRLSLLDRGFVLAIAHIRGGQELGRRWYDDGKLLQKKNTFTDFIACAEHLVAEKYADPKRLYAQGGSAGGLLMGAVVNMRPDLFHGVIAAVPFVDVVTTMLDESIPLTTFEYDEWGDPRKKEYYDYIISYSPYDNVEAKDYPNLLVTTGLHDSQVQYWEPAKWVAKLRAKKTDGNLLLLKTELGAGHGGLSGRFERYRDVALQFAFLLQLAGLADP